MTITVVRHGQTDWNLRTVFQGRSDITLNDTGRKQARDVAKMLQDLVFDVVYSSPSLRAKETCQIIMKQNKHGGNIVLDERIMERSFGDFEGRSVQEAIDTYGGLRWWNLKDEVVFPNGESIADLEKRIGSFLSDIQRKHENKNVLVVAHGGVLRIMYFMFNPKPVDGNLYSVVEIPNCAVAKYCVKNV